MPMPLTRVDRQAKRAEIRDRLIAQAEAEAGRRARSLVCATGTRHGSCHGATVCLCECHDPGETGPPA